VSRKFIRRQRPDFFASFAVPRAFFAVKTLTLREAPQNLHAKNAKGTAKDAKKSRVI
jgi:hypothetical protein